MTNPLTPASPQRDLVVERLSAAFAQDLLTTEEFERRVAEAYRATTLPELAALTRDLPEPETPPVAATGLAPAGAPPVLASAVFSSVERGGRGPLPPYLCIRATFGNVEWDFRAADFVEDVTVVEVQAFCGNVELEFPDDVDVDVEGRTLLGRFAVERKRGGGERGAGPRRKVRVVGRSVLSNVEVEVEPARRGRER